jgi:hypothetical protein
MTTSAARRADRTAYLEGLLPPHVVERDAETGGLLHALLEAVAGELAVVEDDVQRLYDSWFIETCPEWVVPYLADLVGLVGLPGDLGAETGAGVSRRAVVANTVAYRKRKGTVAVVEQVVRDVTGWPTRAVEEYRLLAATTHVNHVHLERPAVGSVRQAASGELESPRLAGGALTRFAHTGEVRSIDPSAIGGRGRFGIRGIGVFVFPTQVHDATGVPARRLTDAWSVHPLGAETPLFAVPTTEEAIEHLATESDLPVPLRPRRLLAALVAARAGLRGEDLPLAISVEGDGPLAPERIRVCGLEDLATSGGSPLSGWQVMVDSVRGLLHPHHDGVPADPTTLHLDHAYGSVADVGAGTYDRTLGHDTALAADPFTGDLDRTDEESVPVRDRVGAQVLVRTGPAAPGVEVTVTDAIAEVDAGWADPSRRLVGITQVVSVADSETYAADLTIAVPAESRLVLVAAHWRGRQLLNGDIEAPVPGVYSAEGLRPHVLGDLHVTGERGASLLVDGLVVEGDIVVEPGELGSLTLSQCTVAGRVRVLPGAGGANRELAIALRRSVVGSLDLVDTVPEVLVVDSVVDPALTSSVVAAVAAPGAHLEVVGSTLFGDVGCRWLEVTSSICDGTVTVVDRQVGCARFSYIGPGSRVPRRFRCVPASDATTSISPSYLSTQPGSPFYPSLAPSAPVSIRHGGEFGSEMGVHHHLRRPQRMDAARRLVAPYVPAGMQIGMFGS